MARMHPMGIRLPDDDHKYVRRLAYRNDVDASRQVRRMIAFCRRHMPDDWLPSSEDEPAAAA